MRVLIEPSHKKLKKTLNELDRNKIILHYTGNMFGIGVSALSIEGIRKIDEIKERKKEKSYIVLLPEISFLEEYGFVVSSKIERVMQQYSPGNVTYILKNNNEKLDNLKLNGKIAVRIPNSPLLQYLIEYLDEPFVSTSINRTGEPFLKNLNEIENRFGNKIDLAILPEKIKITDNPSTIIEETDEGLQCLRRGSVDFNEIKNSYEKPNILFVCTGNICRSPIAEYLMKNEITQQGMKYRSSSAGFLMDDENISENSKIVLQENGIDGENHKSSKINEDIIRKSWLILTMEKNHKNRLLEMYPAKRHKIFTLSEYTGLKGDIDDPYMMNLDTYRQTYSEIKVRIDELIKKLSDND